MYVLNHVEDTVWLDAIAYNRCAPDGIAQRYWFVCSFYGVEDPSTGSGSFNVVPNPNEGQMTLLFERLTGRIDVKVYDMRGALLDHIQTYNETENRSMPYNLKGGSGVYFFVITGKEGTVAKKVIIR